MPMLLVMSCNLSFPGLPRNLCISRSNNKGVHSPTAVSPALHKLIARVFQGYYILYRLVVLFANQQTVKAGGWLKRA